MMGKLTLIPTDQLTLDLLAETLAKMLKHHTFTDDITTPTTEVNSDNEGSDTQPLVEEQYHRGNVGSHSNEHKISTKIRVTASETTLSEVSDTPNSDCSGEQNVRIEGQS